MPPAIGIASTSANAASTNRPSPTGNHAPRSATSTERRRSRPRRRVAFGSSTPVSPVAARETHRGVEHERQQHEQHERAEPTFRDRVPRRGVDAVGEAGRERGPAEADDAVPEPVRPERAQRDREHHHQRASERDRAEEHGAEAAHQRQGRWRGGRRSEAGVAPRRAERVEQVADAGPDPERADRRDAMRDQASRPEQHERRGTP